MSPHRVQARLLSSAGSVPLPPDLAAMPPVSPPGSSWGTGGTAALGQPWAQAARVKGLGGPYGLCVSFQGFSPVLPTSLAPGLSSVVPRSCHARQEGGPCSCCGLASPGEGGNGNLALWQRTAPLQGLLLRFALSSHCLKCKRSTEPGRQHRSRCPS